jgi:hypothetical protein
MNRLTILAAAAAILVASTAARAEPATPLAAQSLSPAALDETRARGVPDTADGALTSLTVVNGNAAAIQDRAFAGAAGLFTIIQNTGNNVVLQNATVVNINIH